MLTTVSYRNMLERSPDLNPSVQLSAPSPAIPLAMNDPPWRGILPTRASPVCRPLAGRQYVHAYSRNSPTPAPIKSRSKLPSTEPRSRRP